MDRNMDAQEYDKIVDKLLQFRGKIPDYGAVNDRVAKMAVYELKKSIDNLLWQIDNYAKTDSLGWIK